MGKNFTGWLEIRLPAIPKGPRSKIEYSDQLERDKPAPDTIPALRRDTSLQRGGGAGGVEPRRRVAAGQGARGGAGAPAAAARRAGSGGSGSAGRGAPGAPAPPGAQAPPGAAGAGAGRGRGGNQTTLPNSFNQRDEIVGNGTQLTFRSRFKLPRVPVRPGDRRRRRSRVIQRNRIDDSDGVRPPPAASPRPTELFNQIYQMVNRTYEALSLGQHGGGYAHTRAAGVRRDGRPRWKPGCSRSRR